MKVIPLEAFRDKIPLGVAIAAVERGFRALCLGEATLPDPLVAELNDLSAEVHVKGAYVKGARHVVLKLATGWYKNRERGLPSGDGLFLLLDATTGAPALLLAEHGYLTDLRTAAAVGLTLKYLAAKHARTALLVGAGAVARLSARAIIAQLPIETLTVWNRTPANAERLVRDLTASGVVQARVAAALEPEVKRHRVIVTATASTTPLIKAAWVATGTHITSVGTGSPEKVELEPELLAKADKVIADRVFQTARYGNLHHAMAAGLFTPERVYGEVGDLAAGRLPGREQDDEITIADLTGVGVQDAAIAATVVESLDL
ncbi:MAG: ornithine cyclodeaminase family protein [Gemmatimonadetes bacterium]|nr:MAG: ornithine cyclodeaminase family protein [Gemmatimonadota bacterium]